MSSLGQITHELRVLELQLSELAARRQQLFGRMAELQVLLLRALEEARTIERKFAEEPPEDPSNPPTV